MCCHEDMTGESTYTPLPPPLPHSVSPMGVMSPSLLSLSLLPFSITATRPANLRSAARADGPNCGGRAVRWRSFVISVEVRKEEGASSS